jgi:DNA-binding PadR family transcriptional regulator
MRREQLKGHLDDGPAHGYAVITTLRERSGEEFTLPEGTVYPALHRLEAAELLGSRWVEQAGRRRRRYELTAKGASALADLQGEWRRFSTGVQAVIGGPA